MMMLWQKLGAALKKVQGRLNSSELSEEIRELELSKLKALTEVFYYIENYLLWHEPSDDLTKKYNLWAGRLKEPLNMSKDAVRASNNRFNAEIERKVGESTIDSIVNSSSHEELKGAMEQFRISSGLRNIKRSYLVDLLAFCTQKHGGGAFGLRNPMYLIDILSDLTAKVDLSPEEKFLIFQANHDRTSAKYGQEDEVKRVILRGILEHDDEAFSTTKEAFRLYFSSQIEFDIVLLAIESDLETLDKSSERREG